VAIVGAGFGGIAAAVQLKRTGIDSFTVFEKAAGPGGVWFQNTYPGCEVDIPSHAYSFSFMPYDWSGTHAKQTELQRYAEDIIDRFGIREHFRFGDEVQSARWDDSEQAYRVVTVDGGGSWADLLVSAVGMLSHPKVPDWPGLATFDGPVFHTSRYDHGVDLTGKRVALVGTGSSACQLAPTIAPRVRSLDVYQREPGHVLPKRDRVFDDRERGRFRRFSTL
jgi:cation diffusion facilitator CzcD-associated flavoprotein CzcO